MPGPGLDVKSAQSSAPVLAVGLMSGTSADGIDVAIICTDGQRGIEFVASQTVEYPQALRQRLLALARQDRPVEELLGVERDVTLHHGRAVVDLLRSKRISAPQVVVIGFHGHTIRHVPAKQLTFQIGDASLLCEQTGIRVVSDFRRRDIAAGGQGAPLAAMFHAALLPADLQQPACVLNLGGVGNLTWVHGEQLVAGDTGPGCGLLDAWTWQHTGQAFDQDGRLASRGTVDQNAVTRALDHPFFKTPFPKSADRFDFHQIDVSHLSSADGAATLCAITAESVARAVQFLPAKATHWYLTGGGSRHPIIVTELRKRLPNVEPIDAIGGRADSLEAECFAWLAVRALRGLPTSLPSTTGAGHPTVGGVVTS